MNWQTSLSKLDLTSLKSVYLVGIKGVGMTALAILLQEAGVVEVSGADTSEEFVTDHALQAHQIEVEDFQTAKLPDSAQAVIFSGAHQGSSNPLVVEAQAKSIPTFSLAEAIGMLSTQKETLAVCGVGGKSTTSALLSWIFEVAGEDPSFAVGVGDIPNLQTCARWQTNSDKLVIEADEYVADPQADLTPRFLYLRPVHLICTSLTFDHPDVYDSFEETKLAFQNFFQLLPSEGQLIINGDDAELVELVNQTQSQYLTVGEFSTNDVQLQDWQVKDGVASVDLVAQGDLLGEPVVRLEMNLPGRHNLCNSAYAAVLAWKLGVPWEKIKAAVKSFKGVQRRFEFKGITKNQVRCFDDYAHHPREIAAVAQTLQDWFPDQPVVVAFEPHTFSRTSSLRQEFVEAFQRFSTGAQILMLPIFASAREQDNQTISSEQLVEELIQNNVQAKYIADYQQLLQCIKQLSPGTIFITLGAGTVYKVFEHVDFI